MSPTHPLPQNLGCATMNYASAVWVSFVSALVYHVSYRAIICCKIDDAVGAGAIHFFCGFWGLLAAGCTVTDAARLDAGYPSADQCSFGSQYEANVLMGVIIALYVRWTVDEGRILYYVERDFDRRLDSSGFNFAFDHRQISVLQQNIACTTQSLKPHIKQTILCARDGIDHRLCCAPRYLQSLYGLRIVFFFRGY